MQVPIQARGAYGGLASADFAPETVKFNLMDALLDLEAAVAAAKSIARMGMFIYRPDSIPEAEQQLIDTAIDSVMFRAPRICHVDVGFDPETIAERVLEWAA